MTNLVTEWSEWQDLNLRPLVPNEVRYLAGSVVD